MKLRLSTLFAVFLMFALASCRDHLTGPNNTPTVSDTIAYWTFDGNLKDVTGNRHDGATIGAVAYGPDRFGLANHAMVLDGNSSVVVNDTTQLNFTGNSSYTISAWVKTDSVADQGIVCKGPADNKYPGYRVGVGQYGPGPEGSSMVWITDAATNQAWLGMKVVADGHWHLLTAVITAHIGIAAYVDSMFSSSVETQSMEPDLDNTGSLVIGVDPDGTQHFTGALDGILILNRALDVEEVAARFHEGGWYEHADTVVKPPPPPPPPNGTLVTGNKFVAAQVVAHTGLITFINAVGTGATTVPPDTRLSYVDKSFLSIKSGLTSSTDTFYTNNNLSSQNICDPIGSAIGQALIQYNLTSGSSTKNADTIETIWASQGPSGLVDIVQDVYPVEFESSGQIVVSVKIVNHYGVSQTFQAQYLNDGMLSNSSSAQDNVFIVNSLGVVGTQWQLYEAPNIPTYFAAFFDDPRIAGPLSADTAAIGFLSDANAPAPMGLISPSAVYHCQWSDAVGYTFGLSNRTGLTFDMATLLQWPSVSVPVGSTVEIMRTSYGTNQMPLSQMPIH